MEKTAKKYGIDGNNLFHVEQAFLLFQIRFLLKACSGIDIKVKLFHGLRAHRVEFETQGAHSTK